MTLTVGIDTCTTDTVVGLIGAGSRIDRCAPATPQGRPAHSTALLALLDGALEESGSEWMEIKRVAVGVGPGSFTGVRIGVATARGLAIATEAQLVGISSLRALATPVWREGTTALAILHGGRGEAFVGGLGPDGSDLEARAVPLDDLVSEVSRIDGDVICAGPQAAALQLQLLDVASVPAPEDPLHRISGCVIADLAARPDSTRSEVLPEYLREPDARKRTER